MNDEELSARIQREATRHQASDRLRAAVVTQIALQSAASEKSTPQRQWFHGLWQWVGLGGHSLGASFAAGVALTLAFVWAVPRLSSTGTLDSELVSHHVRSLAVGPLFDVASSDRHTVKPWFQGKLEYAPEVIDLSADGFQMLGGRVDTVQGQRSAALVYSLRRHFINVFERPDEVKGALEKTQYKGFHIVTWRDGAMQVWAVSDADAAELERFAKAWQAASTNR